MNDTSPGEYHAQDEQAFRVAYLIRGFIAEDLTEAEHAELDEWICASRQNQQLFEEMIDKKNRDGWEKWKQALNIEAREASARAAIRFDRPQKHVAGIRSLYWLAAAAAILLVLLPLRWWQQQQQKAIIAPGPKTDIAPGSNLATLQLADGSVIVLKDGQVRNIARQGNTDIIQKDSGELAYRPAGNAVAEKPVYNILTTPRGGQFRIVLPDGSRVWINTASALTYPAVFAGGERKVQLKGEAYFEVARDSLRPFVVEAEGTAIRVLGTHFNVHAYTDEPLLKISLLEGRVNITAAGGRNEKLLSPGQQARIDASGAVKVVAADPEADLAWKNGLFVFRDATLQEVMQQVQRWYNADIEYRDSIHYHFNAEISRSVPVSKLLELLEQTERVHFIIQNPTIKVLK